MTTEMRMRAAFDCSADEPGELSFKEGDILVDVTESGEDGWYSGKIENTTERGLFPYNYVERIDSESPEVLPTKETNNSPENKTSTPVTTSSANITIPAIKSATGTSRGKSSFTSDKDIKNSLPGFPALDTFEATISGGRSSKTTTSTSWTPQPAVISPKPKLSTPKDIVPMGLGIKLNGQPTPPPVSEKPQLKSLGLKQDASPTRLRSWSTSSVSNHTTEADKTLKPSQFVNGKGTKSALELALSKGSPAVGSKPQQSSNLRSNSFSKQGSGFNLGGIALPGMAKAKLSSSISNDVEEEDGFQMIRPSQLRQKQQQFSSKPVISKPSASISAYDKDSSKSADTIPSWSKPINTTSSASKASNSLKTSTSMKLEEVLSSSPMPRLPSRPTSTASRRSRNSRASSLNSSPNTSTNTTFSVLKVNLPYVKEIQNEKAPPPILKPKPQMAQPNLPPRPTNKSRSTSNPPPLQPKPAAMSSIEILLSKNAAEKKNASIPVTTAASTASPPPRVAKPINFQSSSLTTNKVPLPGLTKPNSSIPKERPSLDSSWRSDTSTEDVNLKPSALLNNRARSATNPTSNTDFISMLMSKPTTKPGFTTTATLQSTLFTASPVSASAIIEVAAKPINNEVIPKKKATPPPPPPSRLPKNKMTVMTDEASKHRYEALFERIHDQGYVDGETVRFIWLKSKLSNEELSKVWKECDPDHRGLLDKHSFVDGMGRIDELLLNKQQQVV